MDDPALKSIDSLILACTHYPIISKEIKACFPKQLLVLDSAKIVANETKSILLKLQLENTSNSKQKDHFFVSDLTPSFQSTSQLFFGEEVELEKVSLKSEQLSS